MPQLLGHKLLIKSYRDITRSPALSFRIRRATDGAMMNRRCTGTRRELSQGLVAMGVCPAFNLGHNLERERERSFSRRVMDHPVAASCVINGHTSLSHHLFEIPQARAISEISPHAQQDHRSVKLSALEHLGSPSLTSAGDSLQ